MSVFRFLNGEVEAREPEKNSFAPVPENDKFERRLYTASDSIIERFIDLKEQSGLNCGH